MKIAIVGSSWHCRKAPFDDPAWDIWGCNVGTLPRASRWFELHDDASIDTYEGHRTALAALTIPLYLLQATPTIPNGVRYPVEAMKAKYGDWFFTSTIAYMLAMALEEGPDEIGLWGVDMAHGTEYAAQKPGCRFFIQVARLAGIKITVPPESEILTPGRLYAFEPGVSWLRMKCEEKDRELRQRLSEVQTARQNLLLEKSALTGFLGIQSAREEVEARLATIAARQDAIERDALVLQGGLEQNTHVLNNWCGD